MRSRHRKERLEPLLRKSDTMLRKVASNYQDQVVEPVEVRYLSLRTDYIPIDNLDQAAIPEPAYSAPECRFRASRFVSNNRLPREYLTVVTPVTEQPQNYLSLGTSQAQGTSETVSDLVELPEEQGR